MLKLQNVSKYYQSSTNPVKALDNISINFNLNEFVAITGESGSGKSSFLNIITCMDTYEEGEIYFKGNQTSFFNNDDLEEFRKRHVSYILQTYGLIDSYSVLDNVMLPLLIDGVDKKEAKKKALDLINRVDLADKTNVRVSLLSGGEKQRVSIARALVTDKEILACDEVTANLDSETSKEIVALIKKLAKDKLVLFVTHDYNVVKDVCTRHIVLSDGKIIIDDKNIIDDDNNEKLDLNYKPLGFKTTSKLALNNITACPKKTIFNTLIFLVISVIISLLLSFIGLSIVEDDNYYNSSYANVRDKYYLSYEANDLDLKGIVNKRTILDDYVYRNMNSHYGLCFINHNLNEDSLLSFNGRMPQNDNEVVVYVGRYDKSVSIDDEINVFGKTFKITGIGHSENILNVVMPLDFNVHKDLYIKITNAAINQKIINSSNNSRYIEVKYDNTISKCKLLLRGDVLQPDYYFDNLVLNEYCEVDRTLLDDQQCFIYNDDFIKDYLESSIHSIYANNEDELRHNIKLLESNNIDYYYPYMDKTANPGAKLGRIVMMALALIITSLLFFVIGSIVTKLNNTAIKDYSIYRMLGISHNDNRNIIFMYNIFVSFIIFNIVYFSIFVYFYIKHFLKFNIMLYLIYLIGVILFNYIVAKKTVAKVYNDSSIKVLKEE